MSVNIIWPGLREVLDFSYSCTVGIQPQAAVIRGVPSERDPIISGILIFGYQDLAIVLRDCYMAPNGFRADRSRSGIVWTMFINDRRWRWQIGPAIRGQYNQMDSRKKFIPWLIRSPYQLACLCLDAMGEQIYAGNIDLPPGLASPAIGGVVPPPGPGDVVVNAGADYLQLGQNTAQSGTNPETFWNEIPAATALENLCAQYGRFVVWDPASDRVSIMKVGSGQAPVAAPVLVASPAVNPKAVPAAISIRGAPVRFQTRLAFRAVGKDWDDQWYPHSELTYAPDQTPQAMQVSITGLGVGGSIVLQGVGFLADTPEEIAAAVNSSADPAIHPDISAAVDDGVLYLTGRVPDDNPVGQEFEVTAALPAQAICTHGPIPVGKGFAEGGPPTFWNAKATERLNYQQARALAAQTIWKCYQLVGVSPADFKTPGIPVPSLGVVPNRYQIVMQDTRPEQIVPRPGDVNRIDPQTLQPFAADVYNGYSKDRKPATFGSIFSSIAAGGLWMDVPDLEFGNTPKRSQFYVDFSIVDPERQVIAFAQPIYRILGGATGLRTNQPLPAGVTRGRPAYLPPDLVVETGVIVQDSTTYAPVRFQLDQPIIGGLGPIKTTLKEEVQYEVIGKFDARHRITGFQSLDADANNRASYFAINEALLYQQTDAFSMTLPSFNKIGMSGLIRVVTWTLSRGGITTEISLNSEYSTAIVPYAIRRRKENIPQDGDRGFQNVVSDPRLMGAVNAVKRFAPPRFGL